MNTLQPVLDFYTEHGGEKAWCQGHMEINNVAWCLGGAASCVANKLYGTNRTMRKQERSKLDDEMDRRVGCYADWNDDPIRTYEDVREMLSQEDQ